METENTKYTIEQTKRFERWFKKCTPHQKRDISLRIGEMMNGEFGDHKFLSDGVWELRFMSGVTAGTRIYYGFKNQKLILICDGGDKDSQSDDIKKAIKLFDEVMKENERQ